MEKIFIVFLLFLSTLNSCNEVVNLNPEDEKKISQKSEQEVRDFIANQYNFFSVGSIDVAKKTFAKDAIIIGTDESEFLVGWDKIKTSLMGQIEVIENPKFVDSYQWLCSLAYQQFTPEEFANGTAVRIIKEYYDSKS